LYNLSSNMIAEMTLLLPLVIVNPQALADRWGTFPPRDHLAHQVLRYDHTAFGDSTGCLSLVKSLLTNHFKPSTPVLASGDEHWLTDAQVLTQPAYSPGGFTNDGLCKQLQTILDWTSPPTQCPEFSFRWMKVAAWKNYEVLHSYNMDMDGHLWTNHSQPWQWVQSSNPCSF
jgi:hypothetical protein